MKSADYAEYMRKVAISLCDLCRFDVSKALYERALEITESTVGWKPKQ